MHCRRYLSQESIKLDICPCWETTIDEDEDDFTEPPLQKIQESITREMAELLYASGRVQNLSKLTTNLFNVEKRSSSAIGQGVAIPHVRSLQTRNVIMGFARYTCGVRYDAPDEEEVKIFIPMIAPTYDDKQKRQYLRLYRNIAEAFCNTNIKSTLLTVDDPTEVIRILNDYVFK